MRPPSLLTPRSIRLSKTAAYLAALAVLACALLVLAGWTLRVEQLTSLLPGLPPVKANTAICLGLLAAALCMRVRVQPLQSWSMALPILAGSIAALSIMQSWFAIDLGIDQLLYADPGAPSNMHPGRMAQVTSIALVVLAIAMASRADSGLSRMVRQLCALVPFGFGTLAVIGHAYGVHYIPNATSPFATMAVPTALSIMLLGLASLAAEPEAGVMRIILADRVGGRFARMLLPVAILFPAFVGWFCLLGQNAGLYGANFGLLVMVVSAISVFSVIAVLTARWLNRSEDELLEAQQTLERRVQERTAELETTVTQLRTEFTLREAAEEADAKSRALFQNALEFAPIGMAVVGLDGHWLRVNRALCGIVGYSEQELLKLTFQDITHPDDLHADLVQGRQLIEGAISSYQMEKRYIRKNREMVWVMLSASLVRDGENKPLYFVAQIEDISERRKVSQDLEGSQKLLAEVIATLPVPFSLKSEDTRWIMANDAMARYSGKPVEELIGKTDEDQFGPEVAAIYKAEDSRALASSEPIVTEGINITASGEKRWVLKYKRGINLPDGRRLVAVAVTDISAHRQAEERLRKSEERFRGLTELSADWYWEQDENFRFTELSGAVLDAVGLDSKSYIGKARWDLAYDNMTAGDWARHRAQLEKREPYRDFVLVRKLDDGITRYMAISGEPMYAEDGSFKGYRGVGRDVSARMRAEKDLADNRQFLSDVIDAIPIPLSVKDDQRRLIIANAANTAFHGLASSEITGKFDGDLYPPDLAEQFRAEDDAVLRTGEPMIEEQAFTTLSGQLRWVIKNKRRITLSDGRRWLIATLMDITNRKQAEAALAERENWLRLVTENSVACIGYIDTGQRFRFCNSTYQKWYGVPVDAILGKSIAELIGKREYAKVEPAYRQAMLGERSNYERTIMLEGTERSIFVDLIPDIRKGGVVAGAFIYSVDITSRVEGEKALQASEERFQIVVRGTDDGIWDWNLQTGACYFSPRYKTMLGFEDSEFADSRESFESRLHADDLAPTVAALKAHIERHEPYETEYRLRNKAGEFRWFHARGQATWDDAGTPVRFSGALRDITQRKQSEIELAESRRFLADLIDAIPIPITVKDESHRFVIVNAAMGRFLGRPAEELQNKSDSDFFLPDRVAATLAEDDAVIESGVPLVAEQPFVTIADEARWVLKHKRRIVSPDGKRWLINALLDITLRKQVELEVERSQKFLESVIEAIPQPVFVKDSQHRWVLFNNAFCELLGHDRAELLGRSDPDIFPEEWVKRVWAEDDQVLSGSGSLLSDEGNDRRADGSVRWLLKSKQRVTLSDESPYIVGISTDITRLKQVEEALRKSDDLHRLLAENSSDMISLLTPQGIVSYASPASMGLLGYPPEEIVGLSLLQFAHPDDAPHMQKIFSGVEEHHSNVLTCRLRRAAGGWMWIETAFRAARRADADAPLQVIAVSRDVDERIRVGEALNRFKYMLDSSLDTILLYDADTLRFNYVNDGAVKTLGYPKEKLLGMAPWELRGDISITDYHKSIEPFLRGDIQSRKFESMYRHADGELIPMDVSMQLVRRAGEPGTFIAVARDATERKAVERLKNEFVSTVSHELRTPVTSIRGSLGLLAGGVAGELPEQARLLVDIAYSNSERLIRLINDILDIEKIESGKMRFAMRPVTLRGLLETPLEENRGYAEQFGVNFVLRGEIPDVLVRVDPDRIMQVMANLLSNAAKFSPRGTDVEVSAVAASVSVRVSVTDHGGGIPQEFQSRIFGKFSQADASDSRKMGGSGLGLSIAKAIVEKHSGTIGFASTSAGTTFFFDLPLAFSGQLTEDDAAENASDSVVH